MEEEEWFSGFWDLPFLKLGFADESLKIVGFCDLKIFGIWNSYLIKIGYRELTFYEIIFQDFTY